MSLMNSQTVDITYGTSTTTTGINYPWETTCRNIVIPNNNLETGYGSISVNENNLIVKTNNGNKSLNEYCHDKCVEFMNDQKEFCITDINVYGSPEPRVVEVNFYFNHKPKKIKAICDKEDEFDLKKGVYIAMSKLLYGNEYTTEGVEEKAKELSFKKDNEKMVNKAIKDYHKKIKAKEEAKEKEKQKKKEELARKKKNGERKKRQRERKRKEEANIIAEAIKIANSN